MLVILMDNQLLPPQAVCQGCVMADLHGRPRWDGGKLLCGRALQYLPGGSLPKDSLPKDSLPKDSPQQGDGNPCFTQATRCPNQYECHMGFRIAHLDGDAANG